MEVLHPADEGDLVGIVAAAAAAGRRLVLRGGGSKADIGAPGGDAAIVAMTGMAGIVDYDPAELVLTVRAGTPLAEVAALVDGAGQILAFDPFDHGPIFGREAGSATIGGIVAAGISGSRRVSAGGVRDHLLGFTAVSGRGERFVAGGKVVKNVTGYDLAKLMCGSWGRLAALTELSLKVLPKPRESLTRVFPGHTPEQAIRLMSAAMGSRAGIAAAAYLPGDPAVGDAITALRLEGVGPSIRARLAMLDELPGGIGRGETAPAAAAERIWADMRTLAPLMAGTLWRVALPASACLGFLAAMAAGGRYLIDWAGGLVWLVREGGAGAVRAAAEAVGGHAMLVRATPEMRAAVPALHPQPAPLAALEARVRRAFDPAGVFETGRF